MSCVVPRFSPEDAGVFPGATLRGSDGRRNGGHFNTDLVMQKYWRRDTASESTAPHVSRLTRAEERPISDAKQAKRIDLSCNEGVRVQRRSLGRRGNVQGWTLMRIELQFTCRRMRNQQMRTPTTPTCLCSPSAQSACLCSPSAQLAPWP